MQKFDLSGVGLKGIVQIDGTADILRVAANAPVVFMFDEHHSLPCINMNIANAEMLIAQVAVGLFGVESHKEGCQIAQGTQLNNFPQFAEHFHALGQYVRGLENEQISIDLEDDINNGIWPAVDQHPFNYIRSHYFLATLFRIRRTDGLHDQLILNVGRKHVDHVAQMIIRGEIDEIAGEPASYVRIRSTAYPAAAAVP